MGYDVTGGTSQPSKTGIGPQSVQRNIFNLDSENHARGSRREITITFSLRSGTRGTIAEAHTCYNLGSRGLHTVLPSSMRAWLTLSAQVAPFDYNLSTLL